MMTLSRKFFILFTTIISLIGLFFSYSKTFLDYYTYQVNFKDDWQDSKYNLPVSDVCFVQDDEPSTVESIWNKIGEPEDAVKVNSKEPVSMRKYTRQNMACYSFSISKSLMKNFTIQSDDVLWEADIKSADDSSKFIKIFLRYSQALPSSESSQVAILPRSYSDQRKDLTVTVSFISFGQANLPAPYETMCSAYNEYNYGRSGCIEKCVDQQIRTSFGEKAKSFYSTALIKSTNNLKKELPKEVKTCEAICKYSDCFIRRFTPIIHSVVTGNTGNKIIFVASRTTTIIRTALPKITFKDLICELFNYLLFWSLISPLTLFFIEGIARNVVKTELEVRKKMRVTQVQSIDNTKMNTSPHHAYPLAYYSHGN